ncbi:MAG: formylglycine-generating enzyme family protein [Bacteroidales bacterium]|nr:formylglycine-generating enzyme family protein [Bacteroidales bacterium]
MSQYSFTMPNSEIHIMVHFTKTAESNFTPSTPPSRRTFTVNGVSFDMIYVEGGTFQMGATSEQGDDAESDEKPVHSVTLDGYYAGETEVTQALWEAVMGSNPSSFNKGGDYPVECVSWDDIVNDFLPKLNRLTGETFRLPTEAEWEYAARGGSKSRGYKYSGGNNLSEVAWYGYYDDRDANRTITTETSMPVKRKRPNELGIYDMSGNVWEWCQDWYGDYSSSPSRNPNGPSAGSNRVSRGGSWYDGAWDCRVSDRDFSYPGHRFNGVGFRLFLSSQKK